MEDKHDAAFEIGRWVILKLKEVHLARDSHSSSYNEIFIVLNIQNIGGKPWTAWETTMPAMHIGGDFFTYHRWPGILNFHFIITQLVLCHKVCGKFNITLLLILSQTDTLPFVT